VRRLRRLVDAPDHGGDAARRPCRQRAAHRGQRRRARRRRRGPHGRRAGGHGVAHTTIVRHPLGHGVRSEQVRGGLYGERFDPPGARRRPAALLIGGSNGA